MGQSRAAASIMWLDWQRQMPAVCAHTVPGGATALPLHHAECKPHIQVSSTHHLLPSRRPARQPPCWQLKEGTLSLPPQGMLRRQAAPRSTVRGNAGRSPAGHDSSAGPAAVPPRRPCCQSMPQAHQAAQHLQQAWPAQQQASCAWSGLLRPGCRAAASCSPWRQPWSAYPPCTSSTGTAVRHVVIALQHAWQSLQGFTATRASR